MEANMLYPPKSRLAFQALAGFRVILGLVPTVYSDSYSYDNTFSSCSDQAPQSFDCKVQDILETSK